MRSADKAPLAVAYEANAIPGTTLLGSQRASIRARLLFDGVNPVDDSPALATIREVLLTPTSEVDLMGYDWVSVSCRRAFSSCRPGRDSPFGLGLYDAV